VNTTSSGGATSNGGTLASGGQAQGGSIAQGGAASGGKTTTGGTTGATGGAAPGGSQAGGSATGGAITTGGVATGGAASGGTTSATGGAASGGQTTTGGATTGGTATGGTTTGGKTGGTTTATGGAASGGRTTTGGTASGGAATGGATATGDAAIGGGMGSSDGKTPIKVWLAGDSTMADGASCSASGCPCGYGTQLDPLFNSNVTVVNNAVGGLTIQTWLYQGVSSTPDANGECAVTNTAFQSRWTNMLSGANAMKAGDYLFISFGINDGDSSCPKHVGEAKYEADLDLMAKAAKNLGVEPILMPPVGAIGCSTDGNTAINIRTPYFTTATNDAGAANNVPVIDLGALSVALYNSLGLCPNSADYTSTTSKVGQFFCQDHTHFQLAGAKQIAQVIVKALKDQVIGLGAYVLN
jgi:lysophospholipase L1-like esterase